MKAVIFGGYKYIHSTKDHEWEELYFLDKDSAEVKNIRDSEPTRLRELRLMVDESLRSKTAIIAAQAELSDEDIARLEALGYVH